MNANKPYFIAVLVFVLGITGAFLGNVTELFNDLVYRAILNIAFGVAVVLVAYEDFKTNKTTRATIVVALGLAFFVIEWLILR